MLGSGLSHLADEVEDAIRVDFTDLRGFPAVGVHGHAGCFLVGRLGGAPVLLQAGRFHAYEGHPMEIVVGPVRTLAAAGVRALILTNAAGGIRRDLSPGHLLLIDDHINMMGRHPLVGPVHEGDERFPDMSAPYDPTLQELALAAAADVGVELTRGTYAAVLGPSYETPAEVRMLGRLGADVVGMSTVPEVIAARARGLSCAAFSMVTNKAAGLSLEPLSHSEVLETGKAAGARLGAVITEMVKRIDAQSGSTE